jgi:hypothetical protein
LLLVPIVGCTERSIDRGQRRRSDPRHRVQIEGRAAAPARARDRERPHLADARQAPQLAR